MKAGSMEQAMRRRKDGTVVGGATSLHAGELTDDALVAAFQAIVRQGLTEKRITPRRAKALDIASRRCGTELFARGINPFLLRDEVAGQWEEQSHVDPDLLDSVNDPSCITF